MTENEIEITFFVKKYCRFEEISSRDFPDIFCFFVIPNLNFKQNRRQAATKVKNQIFSMIWDTEIKDFADSVSIEINEDMVSPGGTGCIKTTSNS